MISNSNFMHALFDSYLEKYQGFIEVRNINGEVKTYFFGSVEELIVNISHLEGNVYFGICPRETRGDGTKKNAKFIVALWADIDVGIEGHKKPSKYKDQNEALEVLKNFEYQPSIIIDSGHGLQCYWLLKDPEEIKDISFIEGVMRGIAGIIGGDCTHDISRIFRIPETMNVKVTDKPELVKIIHFDNNLRYSLADFKDCCVPCPDDSDILVNFEQNIPEIDLNSLKVSDKNKKLI